MLISKEAFRDILKFIQEQESKQTKFVKALEDMCPCSYVDAYVYSDYACKLLDLLVTMFNDNSGDIDYFLYDCDVICSKDLTIEESRAPLDANNNILYKDADTLYDYLVSKMGKKDE